MTPVQLPEVPRWRSVDTAPQGVEIMTKIDDEKGPRNEATLIRRGRLWFVPDMSMYVYYTPTHWHPIGDQQ